MATYTQSGFAVKRLPGCADDDVAHSNVEARGVTADALTGLCDVNAARLHAIGDPSPRAPTVSATAAAGVSFALTGTDFAGSITFSAPGANPVITVTFARPYASAPVVILPLMRHADGATFTTYPDVGYTLTSVLPASFTVQVGSAAGLAAGTSTIWYVVVGAAASLTSTAVGSA